MDFTIVGPISEVETIAAGSRLRVRERLQEAYGKGRWRKRKGVAVVRLAMDRSERRSYIGTRQRVSDGKELKLKRLVD